MMASETETTNQLLKYNLAIIFLPVWKLSMEIKFLYIQEQSEVWRDALIFYRWLHLAGMYGNNIQLYATLVPVRI